MKGYSPYEWFDTLNKLDEQQLPSYDGFYSKLTKSNPLDKEYDDFQKLLNTEITEEQALKKLGVKTKPPTIWKTTTTLNLSKKRKRWQHFAIFYVV